MTVKTLTIPVKDAVYLTSAQRMVCRESIAGVMIALASFHIDPPSCRKLPDGLWNELEKVMELV